MCRKLKRRPGELPGDGNPSDDCGTALFVRHLSTDVAGRAREVSGGGGHHLRALALNAEVVDFQEVPARLVNVERRLEGAEVVTRRVGFGDVANPNACEICAVVSGRVA